MARMKQEGAYIRKYLPQLAKYPTKFIYEPWKARLCACKCVCVDTMYEVMEGTSCRVSVCMFAYMPVCTHHSCLHSTHCTQNHHTQNVHVQQQAPKVVQEQCGCVIGRDYPFPIVEHAQVSKVNLSGS